MAKTKVFFRKSIKYIFGRIRKLLLTLFSLYTNPMLILLTETIITSFFVVYVDPTLLILPIMFWIFVNFYPEINSPGSTKLKIVFLLAPLLILCARYKV